MKQKQYTVRIKPEYKGCELNLVLIMYLDKIRILESDGSSAVLHMTEVTAGRIQRSHPGLEIMEVK